MLGMVIFMDVLHVELKFCSVPCFCSFIVNPLRKGVLHLCPRMDFL